MQRVNIEAYKVTHPKNEDGNIASVVFGTLSDAFTAKDQMLKASGRMGERDFRELFQISPVAVYVEELTGSETTDFEGVTVV